MKMRVYITLLACSLIGLSGCVSSTLDPGLKTAAVKSKPKKPPSYDPAARAAAVQEIKQKADARRISDTPTNINDNGDGDTKPLSKAEIAKKTAELKQTDKVQNGAISDTELAAKQKSMDELKRLSQSHYKDHVRTIEN